MKIADMHCDTFYELMLARDRGEPAALRENTLQVDLMKMRRSGYLLQNFAMFIHKERTPDTTGTLFRMIELYDAELKKNADLIAPVLCYADIEKNAAAGKMSAMLTVEEGAPCRGSVELLRWFYDRGVRMLTLTWNFENELGWPHTANALPGRRHGLKAAGSEIVEEMQRLGMLVDVSHLSDDGFYDVCAAAKGPFVASHSNARALSGHSRNLTDDMIRKLADHGGVTGLNFCSYFLTEGDLHSRTARVAEHAKYIAGVGGMDCVGLGTDFDGINESIVELGDCGHMDLLADALHHVGFSDDDIEKVLYKNVLRVYKDVLK